MKLKTYEGTDMKAIVEQIRSEMGPDAVLMHTKRRIKGGVWGFFGREVIEVLAGVDVNVAEPQLPSRQQDPKIIASSPVTFELPSSAQPQAAAGPVAAPGRLLDTVVDEGQEDVMLGLAGVNRPLHAGPLPVESAGLVEPEEPTNGDDGLQEAEDPDLAEPRSEEPPGQWAEELNAVKGEIAGLRAMLENAVVRVPETQGSAQQSEHLQLLARLGLEEDVSQRFAGAAGLNDGLSDAEIKAALTETVRKSIKVSGPIRLDRAAGKRGTGTKSSQGGSAATAAFVGPTGVGKTTTIAKLAARFALSKRKNVALITADFFRVGAVSQLKTYAQIAEVPLEVVSATDELREAIAQHADKDLILIDTAGHSHNNQNALGELQDLLGEAGLDQIHLVLSATSKFDDLLAAYESFGRLPLEALLFTKLDETRNVGPLISLLSRTGRPLSYLADGQRVPQDIRVADASKLATLLVSGGDG